MKASNHIAIIKWQNLNTGGGDFAKIWGVLIILLNKNLSKVKFYTSHLSGAFPFGG